MPIASRTKPRGQATPASPSDLRVSGRSVSDRTGIAQYLGLAMIVFVRSGVRYAHACRSQLTSRFAARAANSAESAPSDGVLNCSACCVDGHAAPMRLGAREKLWTAEQCVCSAAVYC